jgi:hypothetical protein
LNFNPSGLLSYPYMSSDAPPPRIPKPILPQNQTLAVTQAPPPSPLPSRRCHLCSEVLLN